MQIIAAALLATLAQTSADIEGAYERVSTSRLKFEKRANELVTLRFRTAITTSGCGESSADVANSPPRRPIRVNASSVEAGDLL